MSLEIGPGYGATTDVLGASLPKLTAVEIDPVLAAMLNERFSGDPAVVIVHGDATAIEDIVAEIHVTHRPRENVLSNYLSPVVTAAILVVIVHVAR